MVLLLACLPQEGEGPAQIRIAGKHRQETRADVLELHRRLPAPFEHDRGAPGDTVAAKDSGQFDKRPRILGANVHVDRRVTIIAEVHTLAALGHGVRIENLLTDRRPEQILGLRLLDVVLWATGHHPITRQARRPFGASHFAIHHRAGHAERFMRVNHRRCDVVRA